jgi:dihydrofolate reductase
MGKVILHAAMSLDGFIADASDNVGPLHEWYYCGDTPLLDPRAKGFDHSGSTFKVSRSSAVYVRSVWARIGCIVMGRRLFDLVNGWEGRPPVGDHVVVVSHRPKPPGWHPEASFHFVEDIAAAVATATRLAGDLDIAVNAGSVGSQIFEAELVDEVAMDVVPVVFGSGRPFFTGVERPQLLEDPHVVIQGTRVLHLGLKVRGRP